MSLSNRVRRLEARGPQQRGASGEADLQSLREWLLHDLEETVPETEGPDCETVTEEWIADTRAEAADMPPGLRRDLLEKLARDAEAELEARH